MAVAVHAVPPVPSFLDAPPRQHILLRLTLDAISPGPNCQLHFVEAKAGDFGSATRAQLEESFRTFIQLEVEGAAARRRGGAARRWELWQAPWAPSPWAS